MEDLVFDKFLSADSHVKLKKKSFLLLMFWDYILFLKV